MDKGGAKKPKGAGAENKYFRLRNTAFLHNSYKTHRNFFGFAVKLIGKILRIAKFCLVDFAKLMINFTKFGNPPSPYQQKSFLPPRQK